MDDHRACARHARRSSCSRAAPALARGERGRGDSNASPEIEVESAFYAPGQDISSDTGLNLAYTILFGTAIWQIGAFIHWLVANRRAVSTVAKNAPLDRPGDRRSLS